MTVWCIAVGAAASVALLVAYMRHPPDVVARFSSASFFHDLPTPQDEATSPRLRTPMTMLPFWIQLLVLLATVTAMPGLLEGCDAVGQVPSAGVWVFVDTSYSMSTRGAAVSRVDRARRVLREELDRVADVPLPGAVCVQVTTFDLATHTWVEGEPGNLARARSELAELAVRKLGTDLSLIAAELVSPPPRCPITEVVVVTDQPSPGVAGLREIDDRVSWVWRDVSHRASNRGITDVGLSTEAAAARVAWIDLHASEGSARGFTLLHDSPGGTTTKHAGRFEEGRARLKLEDLAVGEHGVALGSSDDYAGDDAARFRLEEPSALRVDWQLEDRRIPRALGWVQSSEAPELRVVPHGGPSYAEPTLRVGLGFGRAGPAPARFFEDADPFRPEPGLLADLSLDVAEQAGIESVPLPDGFTPVLGESESRIWVARRRRPTAVYIPGLPTGTSDPTGRFSASLFWNARDWLLAHRTTPAPYELTSDELPEPDGIRTTLHHGEWLVDRAADPPLRIESAGRFDRAAATTSSASLQWLLLSFAACTLVVDRVLFGLGVGKWR